MTIHPRRKRRGILEFFVNQLNPVIPVVTQFATGLTETMARRNENQKVQEFSLGLDFSAVGTRPKLAQGSYIVVQHPRDQQWDWSKWKFNPQSGEVVGISASNGQQSLIPYNYVVFGLSKYDTPTQPTQP